MIGPDDIIKRYSLDEALFPEEIRKHLTMFLDTNGAITLLSVGLMLPEDNLELVRTCIYLFNPMVVITGNESLYRLGLTDSLNCGDDGGVDEAAEPVRFTHFAPWYEQNIWLQLFSVPAKSEG